MATTGDPEPVGAVHSSPGDRCGESSTKGVIGRPSRAGAGHREGMSSTPRPLPASLGESFACGVALAHGVTRRRLRAADLERPFRGVRMRRGSPDQTAPTVPGEPLEVDRRIRNALLRRAEAYTPVAPAGAFFLGGAALALHDLPLRVEWERAPLVVGIHPPRHAPRGRGVHGVKVSPHLARIIEVGGLRVPDAASIWALGAATLPVDALIVLGDAIVRIPRDERGRSRPERQRASIEDLRSAALVPRRRGRSVLLEALEHIRVGSMSPLETEFRMLASRAGLPEPELDVEIRDARGRLIGISDAVYRGARVAVEVEGRHHATSDRQWHRDLDKYAALAAEGWEVVRVTSRHIRGERPRAAELVRAALRRHPIR